MFWENEKKRILSLPHKQAVNELIKALKIDSKINEIKKAAKKCALSTFYFVRLIQKHYKFGEQEDTEKTYGRTEMTNLFRNQCEKC